MTSCPLCGHPRCSQTHIICECPRSSHERASLHHDLTLLTRRLPCGPCRTLGRAHQRLLFHESDIQDRGQLWTGLWTGAHRFLLEPQLRACTLRAGQRTLARLRASAIGGSRNSGTTIKAMPKRQPPRSPLRAPPLPTHRPARRS